MEYVNYEIEEIEQDPAALLQSFGVMHGQSRLFHLRDHVLAYRPHVSIGSSARDDEVVRHVGDAGQVEKYDVIGFHIEAKLGGALHSLRTFTGGDRW